MARIQFGNRLWQSLIISFLFVLFPCLLQASAVSWQIPACSKITGIDSVTFSTDGGTTFVDNYPLREFLQTSIAVTDLPNVLFATRQNRLFRSYDGGCHWVKLADTPFFDDLVSAVGGKVYAWGYAHSLFTVRPDGITPIHLTPGIGRLGGLGADPLRQNHIRVATQTGTIWDSTNLGKTWKRLGALRRLLNQIVFDPQDLNHCVASTIDGAFVTFDGGKTWVKSTFNTPGDLIAWEAVIAPSDPHVVWLHGAVIHYPNDHRYIYRSDDGGKTFQSVLNISDKVKIDSLLSVMPLDPNTLFLAGRYPTTLYRYDYQARRIARTVLPYSGINKIVFSPADPRILYMGLISYGLWY